MFNCKKLFKLQIRPRSLLLLITTSQDRWIFPSQSWEVRNWMMMMIMMMMIIIIIIILNYSTGKIQIKYTIDSFLHSACPIQHRPISPLLVFDVMKLGDWSSAQQTVYYTSKLQDKKLTSYLQRHLNVIWPVMSATWCPFLSTPTGRALENVV